MKIIQLIILSLSVSFNMNATDIFSKIDSIMNNRYKNDSPGGAIMILKGDSILVEKYYGIADMSTKEPISELTRFNIASISKQFTVIGALRLVEQGKLSLNSRIAQFFPQYTASFWEDIELWHLMSHTSGLPDSRDRSNRNACVYANDSISKKYFPTISELLFIPGSFYDYKNPTFLLIADIIEKCEKTNFIDYQKKVLFDPLGMSSTFYFDPNISPKHTAHGYINTANNLLSNTDNDSPEKSIQINSSSNSTWQEYDYGEETFFATRPDGGIYSTLRDLALWEKGLRENKIISDSLLKIAYTPHITVTGSKWSSYQNRPNTSYGLGWFIDNTPGLPTKVYHTGDNGGFQAYLAKYPSKDVSIIILENRNDNDRWSLVKSIDNILLDARVI